MNSLVATCEGQFVKSFPLMPGKRVYGFHGAYGLVSEEAATNRMISAKRKKAFGQEKKWIYRFNLESDGKKTVLTSLDGCKVESKGDSWLIHSLGKTWQIAMGTEQSVVMPVETHEDESSLNKKINILCLLFFFIAMTAILMWKPSETQEVAEETVKVAPQVTSGAHQVLKTLAKSGINHRAVQQNLGFLGLVGRKDLKNALGGAQTNLNGTPGAGKGGKGGSGGEFLSGLGRGVRATTVGNTGVQGLGGVGNAKGMGGGLGGYGDVAIASGEGAGISSVAISNGNGTGTGSGVGIDGGLDRHVIQATIAKYLSQVRACYEDRLRINPGLEGALNMDFEIGPSGKLNFSKVKSSSVGDPAVGSCVATKMMGWEFPKPRGGVNVKVNYPFALRPVGR
jgi:hypothetical protein